VTVPVELSLGVSEASALPGQLWLALAGGGGQRNGIKLSAY